MTVKKLSIMNLAASRYIKEENASHPVGVSQSKTPLLQLTYKNHNIMALVTKRIKNVNKKIFLFSQFGETP